MSSSQISLTTTIAHAVSFLLSPLATVYSSSVVQRLQKVLEHQLQAAFAPTWSIHDPSHGSSHRSMTLTRTGQPPRILYDACTAVGVRWSDWMGLLNTEFILMIDPGRVTCQRSDGRQLLVWADGHSPSHSKGHKTKAQQLLEEESDDEIFSLISREVHGGGPGPRPDSRLSNSSSSCGSNHSSPTMSRRERARMAKVFIDPSKTESTQFDGGRTKVLTGGVMLGGRVPST